MASGPFEPVTGWERTPSPICVRSPHFPAATPWERGVWGLRGTGFGCLVTGGLVWLATQVACPQYLSSCTGQATVGSGAPSLDLCLNFGRAHCVPGSVLSASGKFLWEVLTASSRLSWGVLSFPSRRLYLTASVTASFLYIRKKMRSFQC